MESIRRRLGVLFATKADRQHFGHQSQDEFLILASRFRGCLIFVVSDPCNDLETRKIYFIKT